MSGLKWALNSAVFAVFVPCACRRNVDILEYLDVCAATSQNTPGRGWWEVYSLMPCLGLHCPCTPVQCTHLASETGSPPRVTGRLALHPYLEKSASRTGNQDGWKGGEYKGQPVRRACAGWHRGRVPRVRCGCDCGRGRVVGSCFIVHTRRCVYNDSDSDSDHQRPYLQHPHHLSLECWR